MNRRLFAVLATALIAAASSVQAGTISLAWDPVDHPDLTGYRVYFDTVPGNFGNSVDVGLQTATTLAGLADCTTHEVAVKAYDSQDRESPSYSNVISGWARPVVSGVAPPQIERNSQVQLTVTGINFQSGATVSFSVPGISAGSVNVTACNSLTVTATVSAAALIGPVTVRVANPDQVFGEAAGLLSVASDGTAPTISAVAAGVLGATSATITWNTSEPADGQVFFRRQGESGFQASARDAAQTTDHSITLQGLRPESTYEFHVTSVDGDGNSASSTPDALFTTQTSSFTYLRLEAEAGELVAPVVRQDGPGVFSGSWVELPAGQSGTTGSPAGESRIGFHVPYAADWHVWVRTRGSDSGGAAWFEAVDSASLLAVIQSAANVWEWLPGRTYALSPGLHTLRLGGRRGEARADRVIITDDPNFSATEEPLADTTAPGPVTGLLASPGDGANHLTWTNPVDADPLTVVVRFRTDGVFPLGPGDGFPLAEGAALSGSAGSLDHTGLVNGTTYSYALFAIDFAGNVSSAATAVATPLGNAPASVENLRRTDTLP